MESTLSPTRDSMKPDGIFSCKPPNSIGSDRANRPIRTILIPNGRKWSTHTNPQRQQRSAFRPSPTLRVGVFQRRKRLPESRDGRGESENSCRNKSRFARRRSDSGRFCCMPFGIPVECGQDESVCSADRTALQSLFGTCHALEQLSRRKPAGRRYSVRQG